MAITESDRKGSGFDFGRTEAVFEPLRALLGDRFSTASAVRETHGVDEGMLDAVAPDAVAFATSAEEVATIVRVCGENRVPLIAFGAGTSLEGHVAALHGGVSLDVTGLDQILEVNEADLDCRVQTGVHRIRLNEHLARSGLFFPIDPGADATIGGMTATSASGTNAVRYGTMKDNVLGLTAVLASGEIITTGGRARKSSAGYDLTRLLVGSEGTLGIITDITLRLQGIPELIGAAVCSFESLSGAVQSVIEVIQLGVPVARIEFLDEVQMTACNAYSDLDYPERPTLFLEFHGSEQAVAEQASTVESIASVHGGSGWAWSTDQAARNRLWKARHDAYYAAIALRPGCRGMPTDVCVPISQLADCVAATRAELDEAGMLAPIVGHVGDGNFHVIFLADPDEPAEVARVLAMNERIIERALAVGGTCTGEHGIGHGKRSYLRREHGGAVDTMAAIKAALDPHQILNPGKIVS